VGGRRGGRSARRVEAAQLSKAHAGCRGARPRSGARVPVRGGTVRFEAETRAGGRPEAVTPAGPGPGAAAGLAPVPGGGLPYLVRLRDREGSSGQKRGKGPLRSGRLWLKPWGENTAPPRVPRARTEKRAGR